MSSSEPSTFTLTEEFIAEKWNEFKDKFKKVYADEKEELFRRGLFTKKLHQIEEHNAKFKDGLVTFQMGVNNFTDLTEEEMKPYTCGVRPPKTS